MSEGFTFESVFLLQFKSPDWLIFLTYYVTIKTGTFLFSTAYVNAKYTLIMSKENENSTLGLEPATFRLPHLKLLRQD